MFSCRDAALTGCLFLFMYSTSVFDKKDLDDIFSKVCKCVIQYGQKLPIALIFCCLSASSISL